LVNVYARISVTSPGVGTTELPRSLMPPAGTPFFVSDADRRCSASDCSASSSASATTSVETEPSPLNWFASTKSYVSESSW
jgi:hypothetical protein